MSPNFRSLATFLFLIFAASTQGADRSQTRSMVICRQGIVATEHPLASQIGADILAQGGSAVDAAIAANAAMGVLAPMANGIGGDLFAIVYEARTGRLHGLNASGWSPAGLTAAVLKEKGFEKMPQTTIHSVTVPGAVDGWDKLHKKFGRKKLSTLLGPSIQLAEQGFPVSEIFSSYWVESEKKLRTNQVAAQIYLLRDRAPKPGEIFSNPDLAWSYRQIAAKGRKAFYEGAIAKKIISCFQSHGGTIAPEDFSNFSSEWVDPISTTYRGWTVYELPPNGQGLAALAMLNLMEGYPLAEFGSGSVNALQVMIEAKKLAYADMLRYVCDPKFQSVPVAGMLSKTYAKDRSKLIDLAKANCDVPAGKPPVIGNDTTYLCVVDAEGNMVSYIQSIYSSFGSGIVAPGTGFPLHNRGGLFSLDSASPNVLEGRKRPLHTIIPAFMEKGDTRIAFGIMGGWNQAQAHAQFVSNLADHGMNLQAAMEAPRFTMAKFEGCEIALEGRFATNLCAELAAKGHQLEMRGDFASAVGGGQAVMRDFKTGINYGASDPRKDGAAIPEPPRNFR